MHQCWQEVKLGSGTVPVFGVLLPTASPVGGPVISHAVLLAMCAGARTNLWELNPNSAWAVSARRLAEQAGPGEQQI